MWLGKFLSPSQLIISNIISCLGLLSNLEKSSIKCLSYVSCMISSIYVSLGRDYSEMLFKLMSLITQGCGRTFALITSHQVAYSSTLTHMELLTGPWHRATFHKSVALQMLIPHFELPFVSSPLSPFFKVQADSATPPVCFPCLWLTPQEENPSCGALVLCSFVCLPTRLRFPWGKAVDLSVCLT